MPGDMEYFLLKDKGPSHHVYVRKPLDTPRTARSFYIIVSTTITISLLLLLFSLLYVFVLLPSHKGSVLSWNGQPDHQARPRVLTHTHCGQVEGKIEDDVFVFKGIPYAMPPVGTRRWERPKRMSSAEGTCWKGTLQAKEFGSPCVQPVGITNLTSTVGSEDCLFLNVWTQSLDPLANRPVIFWIHGGNLVFGSGHLRHMCPTPEVTKSTDAVYVSINYRLGPLGFLALDTLSQTSSSGSSGNYGFMDSILALRWVRDNIRNFGGDPDKVTVMGEGSGGTLVHGLLGSPLATGLFHRAWLASASPLLNTTAREAARDNLAFLNNTGCLHASCLRNLSPTELLQATPWKEFPFWAMKDLMNMPVKGRFDGALAVIDGHVLQEAPDQAWRNGRGNDVPTLLTTTAQEHDVLPFDPTMYRWTWQHYVATVRHQLTSFSPHLAQRALQLYPPGPPLQPEFQYTSMTSDIRLTCPSNALANKMAQHFRSPVYRAVVTATPSAPVNIFNISASRAAFQGWDLITFFGDFAALRFRPTARDLKFQSLLRQQVMAFVHEGRPNSTVWETVRTCTALLSDHLFPVEHYNKARCDFWLQQGFSVYAAIN